VETKLDQGNIFSQAKWLLDHKNGDEMTEDEVNLVSAAIILLYLNPEYSDVPIGEGLEALARITDNGVVR